MSSPPASATRSTLPSTITVPSAPTGLPSRWSNNPPLTAGPTGPRTTSRPNIHLRTDAWAEQLDERFDEFGNREPNRDRPGVTLLERPAETRPTTPFQSDVGPRHSDWQPAVLDTHADQLTAAVEHLVQAHGPIEARGRLAPVPVNGKYTGPNGPEWPDLKRCGNTFAPTGGMRVIFRPPAPSQEPEEAGQRRPISSLLRPGPTAEAVGCLAGARSRSRRDGLGRHGT